MNNDGGQVPLLKKGLQQRGMTWNVSDERRISVRILYYETDHKQSEPVGSKNNQF